MSSFIPCLIFILNFTIWCHLLQDKSKCRYEIREDIGQFFSMEKVKKGQYACYIILLSCSQMVILWAICMPKRPVSCTCMFYNRLGTLQFSAFLMNHTL